MSMPAQRPGRSEQAVCTPDDFLEAVVRRFGRLTLDLAASHGNAVAPLYFTEETDALAPERRWASAEQSWCNPPFADIRPWTAKAAEEAALGACVLMLVPLSISRWWPEEGTCAVWLLKGRLTFKGHTSPYPKDMALLQYGPAVMPGYRVWDWRKS